MQQGDQNQTFSNHLQELRRRSIWIGLAFFIGGAVGFAVNSQIQEIIIKPLGQTLYYTSPVGGLGFSLQICFLVGIIASAPILIYQLLRFVQPVSAKITPKLMYIVLPSSLFLAALGIAFAYFVSLPNALKFLTHFGSDSIHALITVNEYMTFITAYLGGTALIFQLPLVMLLINRIRPLPPKSLRRLQKPVIIGSFIAAAILTPTPDPINQLIMVTPMILLYEFSCILVLAANRNQNRRIAQQTSTSEYVANNEVNRLIVPDKSTQTLLNAPETKKRVLTIDGFLPADQVSDRLSVKVLSARSQLPATAEHHAPPAKTKRVIDIWPPNLYYKKQAPSV